HGRRECDDDYDDYTGCMDTSEDEGNDEYIERYFVESAPISYDEEEKSEVSQTGMHTH
ncbi:hypothetical protein MKW94_030849, partial [Papaver nudicaule]|nr:hypothetical protein [Papaver nudicaule]